VGDRWRPWVGLGYVAAVLTLTLLFVIDNWNVPALSSWLDTSIPSANSRHLAILGWLGLVVLAVAARSVPTVRQWWLIGAVALWQGSAAMSMVMHGALDDRRYWSIAAIGIGLAASGTLIPSAVIRSLVLGLSWFYGWGSVLAGLSSLAFGWPTVLISEERFVRWLSFVGIDGTALGTLNGLMPGRVYVGLTCGLLFVYSLRVLLAGSYRWWVWLGLPGLVIASAWSLSRTGAVIIVLGSLAALLPWQRWRPAWLIATVFAVMVLPLALSGWLTGLPISDGTTSWRFDLWQSYLDKPGLFGPFGLGPQPFSLDYADHAHQQLLEALAVGGWLGLGAVVVFVVVAALGAHAAAFRDNRAAIALLFGAAAIFQVDVVTFTNVYTVVNNAFVLIVVLLVHAAGSPPHDRLLRETPQTVHA
jgi:hypothetical protein